MKKRLILVAISLLLLAALPTHAQADSGYYIANDGESLLDVADCYAIDAELLALINDFDSESPLAAGTLLRLPQSPYFSVTVSRGDTLFSLANSYGVSVDEIRAQNNLSAGSYIYEGQNLLIPMCEETSVSSYETVERMSGVVYASRGIVSYLWPAIGEISSLYGERWGSFHWGLDIAADHGNPVTAAFGGKVIESGWKNDAYGYTVMLEHNDGSQTLYGHCSALAVSVGEDVAAGQAIAYIGSTGNSTGSHVHFEIRIDGVCVDPLLYLR